MMNLVKRYQRYAEPAAAVVFFVLWAFAETGRHQILPGLLRSVLPWWAALLAVCVAIALARTVPLIAVILPSIVLVAQLISPSAEFGTQGYVWLVYFGLLIVVFGVSATISDRWVPGGFWFAVGLAVAVAGVLVGRVRLDWIGPLPVNGPDVAAILVNRILIFAGAIALSLCAWYLGFASRGWHRRSPSESQLAEVVPPSEANADGARPSYEAIAALSAREKEIFLFAARGLSNAEIARTACISPTTAKSHLRNILAKLGFTSRVQLIAFAYEHQLLSNGAASTQGQRQ